MIQRPRCTGSTLSSGATGAPDILPGVEDAGRQQGLFVGLKHGPDRSIPFLESMTAGRHVNPDVGWPVTGTEGV